MKSEGGKRTIDKEGKFTEIGLHVAFAVSHKHFITTGTEKD
jgi:hypothetical protein